MRALAALVALALVALPACSGETSIVLVIHATDGPSKQVQQLEVHVGTGAADPRGVPGDVDARWWERAELVLDGQTLTFPDGLADRTYELLIRPSSALATDAELIFAVVGRAADPDPGDAEPAPILAFRAAEDVVGFGAGEVRRIDVPLAVHDPLIELAGVTPSNCVWWDDPRSEPSVKRLRERAIVPADDRDCDAYRFVDAAPDCDPGADCDETDPRINPGAMQGCDAAVDDDCCARTQVDTTDADGDGFPACVDCGGDADEFGQPGDVEHCDGIDTACDGVFDDTTTRRCGLPTPNDTCRLGRQVCNETRTRPGFGSCEVEAAAPDLPARVCSLCNDPSGPVDCGDVRLRGGCGIHTEPKSATACLIPVQQVALPPCPIAQCTWIVDGSLSQNGWSVTLVAANDTTPGTSPAPSFTGAAVALRVIIAGSLRQGVLIRRSAGPLITLDVIGLEHLLDNQCGPVMCTVGN